MTDLQQTIENIKNHISDEANFFPPGTPGYNKSINTYYWTSCVEQAACVFQPANPEDVKIIFLALEGAQTNVRFAIKGGGHIADSGFNATTGILVDMALFNQVTYNPATTLVEVGPGLIWEDVYAALAPYKRNVAGATTCKNVGVAGFNLGGGFSNKSNQFGLAIDSIRAIEVVTPRAEILRVTAQHHGDLFWALKGGGNYFGIVTKWTMITHPQGPIFSETLIYQAQHFHALIPAIMEFSQREVPKANVEAIFEFTEEKGSVVAIANVECFYDGHEPPAGLFDPFFNIPHTVQILVRTWEHRQSTLPRNRQTYRVGRPTGVDDLPPFRGRFSCVMVKKYTPTLIEAAINEAEVRTREFAVHSGLQIYPDIWPFLTSIYDHSPPGAWPHVKGEPYTPLVINFKWEGVENDKYWLKQIVEMTDTVHAVAIDQGCATRDAPVYYNLALDPVQASAIYQKNLVKLIPIRKTYDPKQIMDRTGGFRIPI